MTRFAQGKYQIKNPEKYVGNGSPRYRSSWELSFMQMCDTHPSIIKWASEAISIPYRCPITGKPTIYIPDFFIQYADKNGKLNSEIIEVKPRNQTVKEQVGRSKTNQIEYARNVVKWRAAQSWCSSKGLVFRIVNESDIYHVGRKRK